MTHGSIVLAGLLTCLGAIPAAAQATDDSALPAGGRAALGPEAVAVRPTPSVAERRGFLIGSAVGGASLSLFERDFWGAAVFAVYLGKSVSDKAAVACDTLVAIQGGDPDIVSYETTAMLQYWVSSRVWVGGGPGFGQKEVAWTDASAGGPVRFAVGLQVGVETWKSGRFVLDIRGRYGRTFTTPRATTTTAVMAGFTWY